MAVGQPVEKDQSIVEVLSKVISTIALVLASLKYCAAWQVGSA